MGARATRQLGYTGAPGLELVDRQSLDVVLHELNMNLSGLVRAGDAVRAGKLLNADWFLLGTGANINGTNFIVVRLVDSHTSIMREAGEFSADGSPSSISSAVATFVAIWQNASAGARMLIACQLRFRAFP